MSHRAKRIVAVGLATGLGAAVAVLGAGCPSPKQPGAPLAERAFALLEQQQPLELAAMFHYPSSYTAEERAADMAMVAKSLDFLLTRFGRPADFARHSAASMIYEVAVTGGTNPYWESISPFKSFYYLYSGNFASLGRGFVKVELFEPPSSSVYEVRAIYFGLPASRPESRANIDSITADLFHHMSMPVPPDFEAVLDGAIQPSSAEPVPE